MARKYGWHRDKPDARDKLFLASGSPRRLPQAVSLREHMPPVYDQGELGSCTANAIAALDQYVMMKEDASKAFQPSRLFIYYLERFIENTIEEDAGAQIRDGIKAVSCWGACPETMWPYNLDAFATRPPTEAYEEAAKHQVIAYSRIAQSPTSLMRALASGHPVVFGFEVTESFESEEVARTGVVPMPSHKDQSLGGHAVLLVGYEDFGNRFIVRNSWGPDWGDGGYCYMPMQYICSSQRASDFWTITRVEE